jgi:hypothetical protein
MNSTEAFVVADCCDSRLLMQRRSLAAACEPCVASISATHPRSKRYSMTSPNCQRSHETQFLAESQGKSPAAKRPDSPSIPAMTYSRGGCHYHRPWMLNGRVRKGNGCGHPGMLTEKLLAGMPTNRHSSGYINKVAATVASARTSASDDERRTEQRINAVKRLAVSTGQLRRLPALHLRPIDLVVFQEPSFRRTGDLILQRVSRLDAFSVYPGRT